MGESLGVLAAELAHRPLLAARVNELYDMVHESLDGMGRISSVTRHLGRARSSRSQQDPPSSPAPSSSQMRARVASSDALRVLLIDDEPLVLRSLKRMLGRHLVDIAVGGADALAKLATNGTYDVILCDLMMPGMDGPAVYAAIAERFPNLLERLVFCSGGAFTSSAKSFIERSTQPFVEKPMTPETFAEIAQRVLSRAHLRLVSGGEG
jgi:CheY-like chemotaxis protein